MPSTGRAIIDDDLRELRAEVSSPRQRFLEVFGLSNEHASTIITDTRTPMSARLIDDYD